MEGHHSGVVSAYDRIARLYDPWSVSVVEDVPFYLERARRSGGPVLELGVGTGRLAIPIAADGVESELSLAWISVDEWRDLLGAEGFVVEGLYGWFDGTPWAGHEDAIFVCRRQK